MTRFLQLLEFQRLAKKLGNRNFPNSKLGRELETEINTMNVVELEITPGIFNPDGTPQETPKRYEDEFSFTK